MNRRNVFKGIAASLFAFVGGKVMAADTIKETPKIIPQPQRFWEGTCIPRASMPFMIYPGEDESIARLRASLINLYLDQLALEMNPPMLIKRKEYRLNPYQLRIAPGRIIFAGDADDVSYIPFANNPVIRKQLEDMKLDIKYDKFASGINKLLKECVKVN